MTDKTHVAVVAGGAIRLYSMNGEGLAEWATVRGEVTPEDAAILAMQLATFMQGAQLPTAPSKPLALPPGRPARSESARERKLRLDRERKRQVYAERKRAAGKEDEPALRVKAPKNRQRRVAPGERIIPSTSEAAAAVLAHPGLTTTELRAFYPEWSTHSSVMLHNAAKRSTPQIRKAEGRWWPA